MSPGRVDSRVVAAKLAIFEEMLAAAAAPTASSPSETTTRP